MTLSRRGMWLLLLALLVLTLGIVLVPVFLIRPFAPQTPGGMSLSFTLRRWSPLLTLLAAASALLLTWRLWRGSPRSLPRAGAVVVTLLVLGSAWLARQNHFEWMFAPLPDARFARAVDAMFVEPQDMVLAVVINGDAVAYPVRQMAYHHVVEDAVGEVPIVATY